MLKLVSRILVIATSVFLFAALLPFYWAVCYGFGVGVGMEVHLAKTDCPAIKEVSGPAMGGRGGNIPGVDMLEARVLLEQYPEDLRKLCRTRLEMLHKDGLKYEDVQVHLINRWNKTDRADFGLPGSKEYKAYRESLKLSADLDRWSDFDEDEQHKIDTIFVLTELVMVDEAIGLEKSRMIAQAKR
jgi:hypothetical protein